MTPQDRERLFGFWTAFDHPVVLGVVVGVVVVLAASFGLGRLLLATGRIDPAVYRDFAVRWRSWLVLVLLMLVPILLGAFWVMLAVVLLSLLCYREYARVTGLFREKTIGLVVVLGILVAGFAALDHFDRLFFASAALTCGLIAVVTIPQDRPRGYIQRVGLGVLGFVFFGYSFGYLGLMANDAGADGRYRAVLVLVLLGVHANDLFARGAGWLLGGPRLLPGTSPGKTVSGALAALVLTTALVAGLAHLIFAGTEVDRPDRLVILGVLVSVLGQLGGLMLSSIKRDVAIKDTGTLIPGHGGLLDRFEGFVLVPPVVLHYLSLYLGPLGGAGVRLFSGG
jgi:phosphatidate cytidylyltransferase